MVLLMTALVVSSPAFAAQITGFGQLGVTNVFFAVDNGNGTTTLSSDSNVNITNIIIGATDPMALFTFDATSVGDAESFTGPGGGAGIFQEYQGSFSLTNQAGTFTYLEGLFGGALLVGGDGGSGAVFTANTTVFDPLALSTDLPITLINPESFSISLSNITPGLSISGEGTDNATVASFSASFTATADANLQDVQPVPEPGSLILLGSGLLGLSGAVRRRFARK